MVESCNADTQVDEAFDERYVSLKSRELVGLFGVNQLEPAGEAEVEKRTTVQTLLVGLNHQDRVVNNDHFPECIAQGQPQSSRSRSHRDWSRYCGSVVAISKISNKTVTKNVAW